MKTMIFILTAIALAIATIGVCQAEGDPSIYNSTVTLYNHGQIPKRTAAAIVAIASRNVEKMTGWNFSPFATYSVTGSRWKTHASALPFGYVNQCLRMMDMFWVETDKFPLQNNFMIWLQSPTWVQGKPSVQGYWEDWGWGSGGIIVTQDAKDPANTALKLTKTMINLLFAQGSI